MQAAAGFGSIFELASAWPLQGSHQADALTRLFSITSGEARCKVPVVLSQKYGMTEDNCQHVVSVTDRLMLTQTWFNKVRTQKPQTFSQTATIFDPTDQGRTCDFCRWRELTAEDTFGRIESESVVTASNLFKYCEPCHGLVLFKHHNPLSFDQQQLSELLEAGNAWIQKAHGCYPRGQYPLFIWNCLHRAGASQYHGHAQVLLSEVPLPAEERAQLAASRYAAVHEGGNYYNDLLAAHDAVGLVRAVGTAKDRASCFASLSPYKDMEVVILGSSLSSHAFQRLFFQVLRALIDRLGVATFNAAILNISLDAQRPLTDGEGRADPSHALPLIARVVSRGKLTNQASDFGALEVFGGASIGHTDPFCVIAAIDEELHAHGAATSSNDQYRGC
ncbi:hypothetical protein WJX72_007646 [[Myrmecia] bisecta]|uniref:Uncharacterized protein n=1 Tax=[Myrmecia] bisecta TaxID=41462 RepID=A0AAW1Q0S5_9CHLO